MSVGQERLLLALLTAVQFMHILDYVIIMPLGARLMETLAISPAQFSKLVAAYSLAAALSGLLGGFFMDRFERKQALVFLFAGFTLATMACGLSNSYPALLASRFAAGAFGGIAGSVVMAMVGDVIPPERLGRSLGLLMSAFPLASIMGIPAGMWLVKSYGWQTPFLVLASLCFLVLGLCVRLLPVVHSTPSALAPVEQMRRILSHPVHLRGFALSGVLVFAGGCVIPFMASVMVTNIGMGEHELSLIYLFGGCATLISTRYIGACTDRYDKVRLIGVVSCLSATCAILLTQLNTDSLVLALCCTTFFFVGMASRFPPTMALITSAIEPRYRGGFMSVNSAVQQAANSLAATLAGYLLTRDVSGHIQGYGRVGLLSALFMGLTYCMALRLSRLAPQTSGPARHTQIQLSETEQTRDK